MRIKITGGVISSEFEEIIEVADDTSSEKLSRIADETIGESVDYWSDYEILEDEEE